jgi:hypothetical protein
VGLQTIIPGDQAVYVPTDTLVHVLSYADGNFTAVPVDAAGNIAHKERITGLVTEFVAPARSAAPKAADPALSATATEIARLQAQVADLQKKLQAAEASRDAAASRAAELLAQPSPTPLHRNGEGQGVGTNPRVETRIARNVNDVGLARYLNEGWGILHIQFVGFEDEDGESEDRLNVVLKRTAAPPTPPQPEQRAAVVAPAPAPVRTVTGTVVPMSQQIGDDDEYEAEDVPPLPALDPDPLMPTHSAADFTRAVLAARLSTQDTLAMLNDRLKSVARDAYTAFPAPAPYKPLGAVK